MTVDNSKITREWSKCDSAIAMDLERSSSVEERNSCENYENILRVITGEVRRNHISFNSWQSVDEWWVVIDWSVLPKSFRRQRSSHGGVVGVSGVRVGGVRERASRRDIWRWRRMLVGWSGSFVSLLRYHQWELGLVNRLFDSQGHKPMEKEKFKFKLFTMYVVSYLLILVSLLVVLRGRKC